MKKIILFGADGFIGMNIRSYFESQGKYKLVCLNKNDCDLLRISAVKDVIRKHQPHFIINAAHYGGVTSQISFTKKNFFNNISMCSNIVHASALYQSLIFLLHLGSSLEYDQTDKKVHEKIPLNPYSYYATVKATTSLLFEHLAREKKIPYVLMRPFNLYGEHNIRSVIYYIITT